MDGRTTNVPSGASNKRRPVPTTQGRKELKIKTNADIADKLENFTGREGYQLVVDHGMVKFKHNTVKDLKNAENDTSGNGSNSASELGPIAQINTEMLVGALRENNVATLIVRDEQEQEQEQETTATSKDDRE